MNSSINKKRLIKLIDVLRRNSNVDNKLSKNDILSLLEENNIHVNDRKTLYDDFKVLNELGYVIEYDNGYYLTEAPFTLSEIKIIIDSINSLKSLDNKFAERLNDKLYSFISYDEEKQLKKISYVNKHKDANFINRLEDSLEAINKNTSLIIKRKNKEQEEVYPLFLYRESDFYYLYYHYQDNDKIYHCRFDRIGSCKLTNNKDTLNISLSKVKETIEESTKGFYSDKAEVVEIEIIKNEEKNLDLLLDDFPQAKKTNKGIYVKASINNVFFSKIAIYGNEIKISNPKIADKYRKYLDSILSIYHKNI